MLFYTNYNKKVPEYNHCYARLELNQGKFLFEDLLWAGRDTTRLEGTYIIKEEKLICQIEHAEFHDWHDVYGNRVHTRDAKDYNLSILFLEGKKSVELSYSYYTYTEKKMTLKKNNKRT